jgi:hypothetical protein
MAKYMSQKSRPENPEDAPGAARRLDAVCDRLLVLWRAPDDGTSIRIGDLWREPPGFAFAYVNDLQHAFDIRFRLFTEFPHHRRRDDPYRSPQLFPTFAERIPSRKRPDYRAILESWGAEHTDDPLAILGLSRGVLMTDRIELAVATIENESHSIGFTGDR